MLFSTGLPRETANECEGGQGDAEAKVDAHAVCLLVDQDFLAVAGVAGLKRLPALQEGRGEGATSLEICFRYADGCTGDAQIGQAGKQKFLKSGEEARPR
ncbi:hypothetical protein CK222_25705 [Mesorhizobium sp. WSM3866]|nr:hypothetical protein CK221_02455 [Mesorhizobium sp. WSM3868]PBB40778.1 hypothetical protein CK222_25705 [Mesorhizobium sp. WSM3866]PBB58902.1 hypothetical protein CK217_27565 [Mesorhizobium loti]